MDEQLLAAVLSVLPMVSLLLLWLQGSAIGKAPQTLSTMLSVNTKFNSSPTVGILTEPDEPADSEESAHQFHGPNAFDDGEDDTDLLRLEQPLTAAIGQIRNPRTRGRSYCQLGDICLEMHRPRRAISCYRHALLVSRAANDRRRQCIAWGGIARCLWDIGYASAAVQCSLRALIAARDADYREGESAALSHLGNLELARGEFAQAIDCHVGAMVISRELGDRRSEARDWLNLGSSYTAAGEPWRAIDHLTHALRIAGQESDAITECLSICAMAKALQQTDQLKAAMQHWERAICLADRISNTYLQAAAVAGQGTLWTHQSNSRRAVKCYQRALTLLGREPDPLVDEIGWNLGIEHLNAGRFKQAVAFMTPYAQHLAHIDHTDAARYTFFLRQLERSLTSQATLE